MLRGCLEGNVSSPIKENLGLIDVKNKYYARDVFLVRWVNDFTGVIR